MTPPVPSTAPPVNGKSTTRVPNDELWKPPPIAQQIMRCAWLPEVGLVDYLKKKRVFQQAGSAHWSAIRAWTKTEQGVDHLKAAGLDPQSFHLDHVYDKQHTPLWHVYNCHFMPGGANSHFGTRYDREKKEYIGRTATQMADAAIKWFMEKTQSGPNWEEFRPVAAHGL